MLDINLIRNEPDRVKAAVKQKNEKADIDALLALDARWRAATRAVEDKQALRNKTSKEIGQAKKEGRDASGPMEAMKALAVEIKQLEADCAALRVQIDAACLWVPNLPDADVPVGSTPADNPLVREWGMRRSFAKKPLPHWELAEKHGIIDFEGGVRLAGSGFYALVGQGARLERALINFMLDLHTTRHGYTEIMPPIVANRATMTGSGQIPKMREQMYHCTEDDLYLIPTAEVPLTNLYGGRMFDEADLPRCITAWTPCFRREAGAAGKDTRGIIRVHQFDKVELLKITTPEQSAAELEKLTHNAEAVLQALSLPYRVIMLCTGDMSFASAKTYDIELWAPGVDKWLEVSSCSNFRDFQARRCDLRFRRTETKKVEFAHTLNGSGTALPRLMIALLENWQQEDGAINIPDVLRPYTGFDRIG
ncbi:MAG: serine--tRNA ligase [Planctomycetota bacterium]